jgi:hypothetical protein
MSNEKAAEKKAEWIRKRLDNLSDKEVLTPRRKRSALTLEEYADTWKDGHVKNNLKWNSKRYYAKAYKSLKRLEPTGGIEPPTC